MRPQTRVIGLLMAESINLGYEFTGALAAPLADGSAARARTLAVSVPASQFLVGLPHRSVICGASSSGTTPWR